MNWTRRAWQGPAWWTAPNAVRTRRAQGFGAARPGAQPAHQGAAGGQRVLPPILEAVRQARIRRIRNGITAQRRILEAAGQRLQALERFVTTVAGDDADGDELAYETIGLAAESPKERLQAVLAEIFEELHAEGHPDDFVEGSKRGLKVPALRTVNARLAERAMKPLTRAQLDRAYMAYLQD